MPKMPSPSLCAHICSSKLPRMKKGWKCRGEAPYILAQPHDVMVHEGEEVQLSLEAGGQPAPTLQWYHGSELLPGQTEAVLDILEVHAADAGFYTCQAGFLSSMFMTHPGDMTWQLYTAFVEVKAADGHVYSAGRACKLPSLVFVKCSCLLEKSVQIL